MATRRGYARAVSEAESHPSLGGRLMGPAFRDQCARVHAEIPLDAGGGASLVKVLVVGDLIVAHGLRTVVELGVYRGRLLLPLGRLLTSLGEGSAIGIDPYSAAAAVQTDEVDRGIDLVAWPTTIDWDGLHAEVSAAILRWTIGAHTSLIRERSHDAAPRFAAGTIDLLHVDGNHDAAAVTQDLKDFLPAVRPGGFVVLDDIGWASVLPHFQRLATEHQLVFALHDLGVTLDGVGGNDFAIFRLRDRP
jgi:hypothetical protein